ncbi:hypothetical protein [Nitrospira moscoviensis]|uniref:hypothetical protein n=1 Tax=Nitrospira moscoviensis TaxID=42253 RepID=UPI0011AE49BE|nr:hypothetical protein [Nitrospira moscoviensis]
MSKTALSFEVLTLTALPLNVVHTLHSRAMSAALHRIAGLCLLAAFGCAGPAVVGQYSNQQRLIGQSKAAVLACAGAPRREQAHDGVTLLYYYREAPVLEASPPVGKGTFSAIRHGCWATVVVAEERVTDVVYRFEPPAIDASNDCEAIFDLCISQR